jgi:chondroitin synthase
MAADAAFRASVVVPLLRQRDEWLARAIASALVQTAATEVLVVTSRHTPPSNLAVLAAAARQHPGRLVVVQRQRDGFAHGVNTGITLARAQRVGLLLSDDWLDPEAVDLCLQSDADIVSTGAKRYDLTGAALPHLHRPLSDAAFARRETPEQRASYLTHFFVFRREKVLEAGGLDETLGDAPGIDDYDLIWTMLERGATVALTPRPVYNFTIHAGERLTMRDRLSQLATLDRIFDKHGFHGPLREQRRQEHLRWFGRPEDVVFAEVHQPQSQQ